MPAPVVPLQPLSPRMQLIRGALLVLAVLLLTLALNVMLLGQVRHFVAQQQLSDTFRAQLKEGVAPVSEGDFEEVLLADGAKGLPASLRKRVATDRRLKVALRSPANRVVCPSEALPSLRAALLRPDCPEAIRRSHLIDTNAHAALLASDLEGFFELRRYAIIAAEERWVQEHGGKVDILREPRTYAAG